MPGRKISPFIIALVAGAILLLFGGLLIPLVLKEPASPLSVPAVNGTVMIASPTVQDPNQVLTRSRTPTFTPTPLVSVAAAGDALIFEDTFIDNRNNWYTESPRVHVLAGTYTQAIDCPDSSPAAHCGNFIEIPFTFPGSFRMEIETTITRSSEGADVRVGFQVRRSDEGYYYVTYGLTGSSYQLSRVTQTGAFPIIEETQTDQIAPAVGDTNILGIQIKGAEFTPLLNGHEMAPARDGSMRTAGESYLVVLVERGQRVELQFDNLAVRAVD
jgi:hypothetical protein